jgi:hypothetical protein
LPLITADTPEVSCDSDVSVCSAYRYGYCEVDDFGSECVSGCVTDDDCPNRMICVCGNPLSPTGGICTGSNCVTDADCEPGLLCASYDAGCAGRAYGCQTPEDQCLTSADCPLDEVCQPERGVIDGVRMCGGAPMCGRPFLVAAQPRVAPIIASSDWLVRAI